MIKISNTVNRSRCHAVRGLPKLVIRGIHGNDQRAVAKRELFQVARGGAIRVLIRRIIIPNARRGCVIQAMEHLADARFVIVRQRRCVRDISCGRVIHVVIGQASRHVILIHGDLVALMVGDRVQKPCRSISICVRRLEGFHAVCNYIILDFFDPVKSIVQIFYFFAVSVGQGLQFAVVIIVRVRCQSRAARRDRSRVAASVIFCPIG